MKAGESREIARRLGREQRKTACKDGGLFWVDPYACVRIAPIGSECSPVNQMFGNLPWESFKWLNKSSPQNKIKISKKRWPERCRSWIFNGKTGQLYWSLNWKWPFTVFFASKERCHGNFANRFWQEHDRSCLCYDQRRNVLTENLYYPIFSSKKYYRRPDIGNVVAELYSNGPYDRNSKFQCFEKVHLNFLYYSVLENNALQRNTSNGVRDCGRWIAYSRRKTHSVILHTFLLGVA